MNWHAACGPNVFAMPKFLTSLVYSASLNDTILALEALTVVIGHCFMTSCSVLKCLRHRVMSIPTEAAHHVIV